MSKDLHPDGPLPCDCGKRLQKNWGRMCDRCGCHFCNDCLKRIGGDLVCFGCTTYEETEAWNTRSESA